MGIIKALKLGFDYFKYDDDGNIQETQRAVDEVSVDIQEGEFVAVLGHNGSENPHLPSILTHCFFLRRELYGSITWIP